MYCYTYINQFSCIFNELQLWTHISSDHPSFLKTVATLSNIKLPKVTEDKLDEIHKMFMGLYNKVINLKKAVNVNPNLYAQHNAGIKNLIDEFIIHDTHAINFYQQLLMFGTENKVWIELVKHIINEQAFMLELFNDLRQQLS
ncbi:MAG: DUF2935 domain-containing protein [Clostridium sp.]|uniref:DUF2935 domain-containing protein n=1 Tax=Clostridium sp. TaxID=1506 RepID=UPI003D6D1291